MLNDPSVWQWMSPKQAWRIPTSHGQFNDAHDGQLFSFGHKREAVHCESSRHSLSTNCRGTALSIALVSVTVILTESLTGGAYRYNSPRVQQIIILMNFLYKRCSKEICLGHARILPRSINPDRQPLCKQDALAGRNCPHQAKVGRMQASVPPCRICTRPFNSRRGIWQSYHPRTWVSWHGYGSDVRCPHTHKYLKHQADV